MTWYEIIGYKGPVLRARCIGTSRARTHLLIYSLLHAVYLTTGPQPLPKPVLHTARSTASSFSFQYPLVFWGSSSSCLLLLSRPPAASFLPSIFPSITCFTRQFLPKMWSIQLAFHLFIVQGVFHNVIREYKHLLQETRTTRIYETCTDRRNNSKMFSQ